MDFITLSELFTPFKASREKAESCVWRLWEGTFTGAEARKPQHEAESAQTDVVERMAEKSQKSSQYTVGEYVKMEAVILF